MIHNLLAFDLYLFDFDGLLVNTEEIHFEAYQLACRERHLSLHWTFNDFCRHAHYSSALLRQGITQLFPELDHSWNAFYRSKSENYVSLVRNGQVELMPGVQKFLELLFSKNAEICVVTHSNFEMIDTIRKYHPILQKIPHWITREGYKEPKPSPDGYLTAMGKYLIPGGKAVGFEDSPRGMQALLASGAEGVWVSEVDYPEMSDKIVYPSFEKILQDILPASEKVRAEAPPSPLPADPLTQRHA